MLSDYERYFLEKTETKNMKIKVVAKCSDCCQVRVPDLGLEKLGYVPQNLGIGGGDYVEFSIDSKTGKIDGWKPLNEEDLRDLIPSTNEET